MQPGADVTFVCTAKSKVRRRGRSMAGLLQGTPGCVQGHSGCGDSLGYPAGPTEQRDTQGCTHGGSRAQEQLCPYGPPKPPWVLTQLYGTSLVPTSPPVAVQPGTCRPPMCPSRWPQTSPPLFPPVSRLHPGVDTAEPRDTAGRRRGLQWDPDAAQRAAPGCRSLRLHWLQHAGHGPGHRHTLRPG